MKKIKNIIFDYGNVIFAIDFLNTQNALAQLGIKEVKDFFAHKGHNKIFDDFETGSITPAQFRDGIRKAADNFDLKDEEIDAAWNSLLLEVPGKNHEVLLAMKAKYRTFLLSNNNKIHCDWIFAYIKRAFNLDNYDSFFEHAYFSQDTGMRKPNPEIFKMVLAKHNLNADETLFIDDSAQHIAGAQKAGLHTLLMDVHPAQLHDFLVAHQLL